MKPMATTGLRAVLLLFFLTSAATPASADWLLTPYIGVVFGGEANTLDISDLDEQFDERMSIGGSISWMGGGVFGFELDYSYTPNFFQLTDAGEDVDLVDVNSSISTLMGNLIIGIPIGGTTGGGVRPYVTGGAGLMRANLEAEDLFDDLDASEFGLNFGGGVHVFFSDSIGLRGDLRYFRALDQEDDDLDEILDDPIGLGDFDYWRGTIGLTFRFGG